LKSYFVRLNSGLTFTVGLTFISTMFFPNLSEEFACDVRFI